ncbi:MAG: ArdC family protein [Microcystis aeruginosa]
MSKPQAIDKFQLITDKLIGLIERGVKPWTKSWHATPYQNLITGHQYTGINPILCGIDSTINQWEHPFFVSFIQAKQVGWTVKNGSKSTWLRWGGTNVKETENPETGEVELLYYKAFKFHNVFNVACIDDSNSDVKIDSLIRQRKVTISGNNELRLPEIEQFIQQHLPKTQFGGNVAMYHIATDTIRLPEYETFSNATAYYATYLHELVHWTGHQKRCNRPLKNKFGSWSYAFEELIAEIGAAMVCNQLGIDSKLEHHASYLDFWLKILKDDKKAFFDAARLAIGATQYLTAVQQLEKAS